MPRLYGVIFGDTRMEAPQFLIARIVEVELPVYPARTRQRDIKSLGVIRCHKKDTVLTTTDAVHDV